MKNKIILVTLSALLLALSAPADAQQPTKVPRIGYLSSLDPAADSTRSEAIRLAREADRRHDSAERLG